MNPIISHQCFLILKLYTRCRNTILNIKHSCSDVYYFPNNGLFNWLVRKSSAATTLVKLSQRLVILKLLVYMASLPELLWCLQEPLVQPRWGAILASTIQLLPCCFAKCILKCIQGLCKIKWASPWSFLMSSYWGESSTHCRLLSNVVWVDFILSTLFTAYLVFSCCVIHRVNPLIFRKRMCLHDHKLSCFVFYFHNLRFPPGTDVEYCTSLGSRGVGFLWLQRGWQVFCRLFLCDWWSKTRSRAHW